MLLFCELESLGNSEPLYLSYQGQRELGQKYQAHKKPFVLCYELWYLMLYCCAQIGRYGRAARLC